MPTKHIDIRHNFMRDIEERKDMDIKYISSKEKPEDIMMNNFSEADHDKHAERITEGEIWVIVETGRENVNNNGVLNGFTDCKLNEYYSHALANAAKQEKLMVGSWLQYPMM